MLISLFSWLREFIDDPYRGHVALVEFLQHLHLHPPVIEEETLPKKKGKPDVLARNYVRGKAGSLWGGEGGRFYFMADLRTGIMIR